MNEQPPVKQHFKSSIGWVDELENPGQISGWVVGGALDNTVEVVVSINGEEVGRVLADQYRQPNGWTDSTSCGFLLELEPRHYLKQGDVVRVRSIKGDFPFSLGVQRYGFPCSPTWIDGVSNCLVVGHSHIVCLTSAYSEAEGLPLDASFIQLHQNTIPGTPGRLADKVIDRVSGWLAEFEGQSAEPVLVISPYGNEHNALGLLNHPVKFDFIHPEQPELPVSEQAELLPYSAFHEVMAKRCAHAFEIAGRLSEFPVKKCYWIEVPPPIFSEEYIRAYPRGFKDNIERCGVAPAFLRYKVWLLRATVIREWCRVHGWGYIPVPERAKDEHGFMHPQAWPYLDAVHGNPWFGEVMLREIEALVKKEAI